MKQRLTAQAAWEQAQHLAPPLAETKSGRAFLRIAAELQDFVQRETAEQRVAAQRTAEEAAAWQQRDSAVVADNAAILKQATTTERRTKAGHLGQGALQHNLRAAVDAKLRADDAAKQTAVSQGKLDKMVSPLRDKWGGRGAR